jgi:4-hydroxy-tetrahydrodipicolinate reductase
MKKIKIGLFGASGKMGQSIRKSLDSKYFVPFLAVSSKSCDEFAFTVVSLKNVEEEILEQVDVWIDFSSPEQLQELLQMTTRTPIVTGTTGCSEVQIKKIKAAAKKRPLFWASNMSVGVWALRQALKALGLIKEFDFKVEEIHHRHKKDNPGGTAKTLRGDLERIVNKKVTLPLGKRIGDVFGIHKVTAASKSETLTFEHTALNREVFAEGALKAARWIVTKKHGYYSMDNLQETK